MGFRNAFYYDNRRNLTCVLDPQNGLTYYTYDDASRMTSVTNPWGEVITCEYSPGGRLLKRVLGNGCVTYYGQDVAGQTSHVDNLQSNLSVISSFEYARQSGQPIGRRGCRTTSVACTTIPCRRRIVRQEHVACAAARTARVTTEAH